MKPAIIKSFLVGVLVLTVSLLLLALSLGYFHGTKSPIHRYDTLLLDITSNPNLNEPGIRIVIEEGANVNGAVKDSGATPLILVAGGNDQSSCLKVIKFLMDHGANPYAQDKRNRIFLQNLLDDGTSFYPIQLHELTRYLVSKNMSDLFNIPGWGSGVTPAPAQQNAVVTPVLAAVKNLEVQTVTLTLMHENGVNLNYVDSDGYSILAYALNGRRNTRLLSHLISLGVDWKQLNPFGGSLLHTAARICYMDGVRFFLDKGLNINEQDLEGRTPLHMALLFGGCGGDALEMARFLVRNGADVNIRNKEGHPPAYYCNGTNLCKLLKSGELGDIN